MSSPPVIARPAGEPGLDSTAALAVIRAGFDAAHTAVGAEAARFAADIEHLVAGADGWEAAQRLAEQDRSGHA